MLVIGCMVINFLLMEDEELPGFYQKDLWAHKLFEHQFSAIPDVASSTSFVELSHRASVSLGLTQILTYLALSS